MKILSVFLVCLVSVLSVRSQSTLPLRADTVLIEKVGGNANLKLKDVSRDSTGGIYVNIGGGVLRAVKTKKLNDTTYVIGLDTIRFNKGGSSGGSISLSNVGSGFRLVKTANGQIKTVFFSYGVIGDSTSNTDAITLNADTTSSNHLITLSDLQDAIAGASVSIPSTRIPYGSGSNTLTTEAALNYNATTNKLTADSIRAIKIIPDTVHIGLFENDNLTDTAVFTGTSITAGVGATTAANNYVSILSGMLRVGFINLGLGGYLLQHSPGWPLTNTFKDVYTTVIPDKRPGLKYLFFAWGENDITNDNSYHSLFGVDTAYFKRDYVIVINYALAHGWALSDIRIISPFYQLETGAPYSLQQNYFDAGKHIADSMGIPYIDVLHEGKNYGQSILSDGIHPSNYGHSLHALSIYSQLIQPLQIRSGENLVNAGTTVLNKTYFFGKDTAIVPYQLMAVGTGGLLSQVPSDRFIKLRNSNIPTQSGSAGILGNFNAGTGLRAMGVNGFNSGAGFQIEYSSPHGILTPFDHDLGSSGNIYMPFSKLIILGNQTAYPSPFTDLYVNGSAYSKGMYITTNNNIMYNPQTNETTLNLLVSGDTVGHIATYGYNGGTPDYYRTSINGIGHKPTVFGTLGQRNNGAIVQIAGQISIDTLEIASDADTAVVYDITSKKLKRAKINGSGGGGLTGSGTSGRVAVWNGTSSLTSDANFTWASQYFRLNAFGSILGNSSGNFPYMATVNGASNDYILGYVPTVPVYSKGYGLYIDTNNNVGLATSVPSGVPLKASGNSTYTNGFQSGGGNYYHVRAITTTSNILATDFFITVDASGGSVTLTLPAASSVFGAGVGIRYEIQRLDNSGNTITIQRTGSDTINGTTSFTIASQYEVKGAQATSTSTWAIH